MVLFVTTNQESIAKVIDGTDGDFLFVTYLIHHGTKVYKGAKVFSFEKKSTLLESECVTRRSATMEELGFKEVGCDMYVELESIDDDSSSEIDDESEAGSESEDSFVVPDDEDLLIKPPDFRRVDAEWSAWKPTTSGARRFKEKVDQIESYMNHAIDEKFVFKT